LGSRRAGEGNRHRNCPQRRWRLVAPLLLILVAHGIFAGSGVILAQQAPKLLLPSAIAYDASGNLFIVDTARNQVLESTVGGAFNIVVGTGVQGFGGDGGAATSALLNAPRALAIGTDGTLFIADTGNQRIRAVNNGVIQTVAGTGQRGFSGDGGAATAATLAMPTSLAVDTSGALLICDTGNQRVRRISRGVISTIAGNGVEGFAGDGGMATAAELDSPAGVTVTSDGRIMVADSHNDRVREILPSGMIETFAGSGTRGFAGDGGPAAVAEFAVPQALAIAASGQLLLADTDNHRVRTIDSSGVTATIAGAGVQGASVDGAAAASSSIDTPAGTATSPFGWPAFVDSHGRTIRIVTSDGALYEPAGLASNRSSSVSLLLPSTSTYGQLSGTISVTGSVGTPQGQVSIGEAQAPLQTATLASGVTTVSLSTLSAGSHMLIANYEGDGLNPSASSSPVSVTVNPASATATANPATMLYGEAVPALTGILSGVLPQDTGSVTVVFKTSATSSSSVGDYPIQAVLSGPASDNYALSVSLSSGGLHIAPAPTTTVVQAGTQTFYAGTPLLLSATVTSATPAAPVGSVQFLDGGNVVAQGAVNAGTASGFYLAPSEGTHSISATFSGSQNFASSTAPAERIAVNAMPDFGLRTSGGGTALVQGGEIANYSIIAAAEPGPFTGNVALTVQGLPSGATATFSPPQIIPGAGSAISTLSIQTKAPAIAGMPKSWSGTLVAFLILLPLARGRRIRSWPIHLATFSVGALLFSACGCGARTVTEAQQSVSSYTVTVTGTSTNLVGTVVTHTTTVVLNVQ
jgi:sugar lactone lactonase YvrE